MSQVNAVWRSLLYDALDHGDRVEQDSAGAAFRGRTSLEMIAKRSEWPMDRAVVTCPVRKLGYKFLAAEAAWILSGSNRLEEIAPFAPQLSKLSDDGVFMSGAYGPPFVEQLPYALGALLKDYQTRQAVMTIWRPRPGPWRDVPCTLTLQWLLRGGSLNCIASMRSNDLWMGTPYDVHTFSMCSAYLALHLRERGLAAALGTLYLTAGSQHLYVLDRALAERSIESDESAFDVAPINLDEYRHPRELIDQLWSVARRDGRHPGSYLLETIR